MRNVFVSLTVLSLVLVGIARAANPAPAPSPAPALTPSPAPTVTQPNIHIASCKVLTGQPILDTAFQVGLGVRFTNHDSAVYKEIVWRAKLGPGYVDFIDDGEFSPEIQIDNFLLANIGKAHVNILGALLAPNGSGIPIESEVRFPEYASLGDPENCQIIKTVTQDTGVAWSAPGVPVEPHYVLPAPAPSTQATLAPGEVDTPKAPVDIAHCHLFFPARHGAEADIGFRSVAPGKTADSVTFRVNYGRGDLDVTDEGAFANLDYVRHKLSAPTPDALHGRSYFSLDDPSNCAAVGVHYTDGTTWTNPAAPSPMPVPTKVPDELDRGLTNWIVNWHLTQRFPAPTASPQETPAASGSHD